MGTTMNNDLAEGIPATTQYEISLELTGYKTYRAGKDLVTVPRSALQALAEWAYPVFAWDRIRAKLPAQHPRWTSHNIHDDMCESLERDRMAYLKGIFWKAQQEAARRERALDPSRAPGHNPSLETFMECVAEMDNPSWDEPLDPKAVVEMKKNLRAKNAEKKAALERVNKWEQEREHPTPESAAKTMAHFGDTALFFIGETLASDNPEIRAKAQEEIRRLMVELQELQTRKGKEAV
jgi:hypothetical protein